MSVQSAVQLPDQPADGAVIYHPLGGNGFVSPHSVYHVRVKLEGDASGGNQQVIIRGDPRFVQLVESVQCALDGISADTDADLSVTETNDARHDVRVTVPNRPISGLVAEGTLTWCPPPFLFTGGLGASTTAPYIRVTIDNLGASSFLTVYAHIYNFDKQARNVVPIEDMTRVLVRTGATVP